MTTTTLPKDADLMQLDPKRPHSALDLLRAAGHEQLGRDYLSACEALNRCGQSFMRMQLDKDDVPGEQFGADMSQHPGFAAATAAKTEAWTKIEAVRAEAMGRLFE
ncbi:MAG: hypothetical protein RR800_00475 [Comamonas sp.]